MATFIATGGPPPSKDEKDLSAAQNAIILAALNAGAQGININNLIADLTTTLPAGQAKYVTPGRVRQLCFGPNSLLTLEQGRTIKHKDAPSANP